MFLVVALCVIVPIVELAVFVQVAQWIGVWEALFLLLAVSLLGVWLIKAQGVAVYRKGRADMAAGKVPGRSMVDGLLIFSAGVLLLIPGFVTALAGLALLVPPTRVPVREYLIRRWSRNARMTVRTVGGPGGTVISADSTVRDRPPPPELGPGPTAGPPG
ncbi:MAG: FxsA family protein [Actinobacteria bacterium]|nr:FxsA family protein [Actinomycetota bacterium]